MLKWWRKWKLNRLKKWDEELRAVEIASRPQIQRIVSEESLHALALTKLLNEVRNKTYYQPGLLACFKSDYKVSPGKVEIKIHEYYVNTVYPRETYEEIRKVINAAADFYGKSVLLQKE